MDLPSLGSGPTFRDLMIDVWRLDYEPSFCRCRLYANRHGEIQRISAAELRIRLNAKFPGLDVSELGQPLPEFTTIGPFDAGDRQLEDIGFALAILDRTSD